MGQRSRTESVIVVLICLLQRRTWKQADLAREVGVESRALRRILDELCTSGVPLERQEEHPHVYWSVPNQWVPGGIIVPGHQAGQLLGQLLLAPQSETRDSLIHLVAQGISGDSAILEVIKGPRLEEPQLKALDVLRRAAAERVAAKLRYHSVNRGTVSDRVISVHRVEMDSRPRFVATCHNEQTLKWFRLDAVEAVQLSPEEPFALTTDTEVEDFIRDSAGGFHAGEAARPVDFLVRDPHWRWVERNLPTPLKVTNVPGGKRFRGQTAALAVVARFVVGLGEAAEVLSSELAAEVRSLAEGALANAKVGGADGY